MGVGNDVGVDFVSSSGNCFPSNHKGESVPDASRFHPDKQGSICSSQLLKQ